MGVGQLKIFPLQKSSKRFLLICIVSTTIVLLSITRSEYQEKAWIPSE